MVIGLELNFLEKLYQTKILKQNISLEEMEHEIQELLKKGAIKQTSHSQIPFTSNIFLKEKKEGRYWLLVNLQQLNQFLPISLFQNGGS